MDRSRVVRAVVAGTALLAGPAALAGCAAGGGTAADPMPVVAEFGLGRGTPEEQEYVLTPPPGSYVEVLPAPAPGPPLRPAPPGGPSRAPAAPPPSDAMSSFEPSVAWVDDGRYLGVITWGSSSCPSGPEAVHVVADQVVEIRLVQLPVEGDACTADMSGHVTVLDLPDGVTPTERLVARFDGSEVTIEGVGR